MGAKKGPRVDLRMSAPSGTEPRRLAEREAAPYSPLWNREREWLLWQSSGRGHGLRAHKVTGGGHVEEAVDREHKPRKKIIAISSRQWERA
jgi:hypothetical protein